MERREFIKGLSVMLGTAPLLLLHKKPINENTKEKTTIPLRTDTVKFYDSNGRLVMELGNL